MSPCLFCRIVAGELPAQTVLETPEIVAFLDIQPIHPGHVLVVPKLHVETIFDAPETLLAVWIAAGQRVARAVRAVTGCAGVNLGQNNGLAAGQAVPHLHLHVIPRFAGDGLKHWPGQPLDPAEGKRLVEAFRVVL